MELEKLGDLVEIVSGQILNRVEANQQKGELIKAKYKVVLPKAIVNGKIEKELLDDINVKADIDNRRFTKAGDVIIKLTTPYDAAYIDDKDEGILMPSYCAIMRIINKKIHPEYLLAFINSGAYLEQVKSLTSGANIPMLTIAKIKEVNIPIPDYSMQTKISKYYINIIKREQLMNEIVKIEREKLAVLIHDLGGEYFGQCK